MQRLYGECRVDEGKWRLDVEPQVAVRAKRVFPKIEAKATTLYLEITLENSRELLWFLDRYPLKITPRNLSRLKDQAEEHRLHIDKIHTIANSKNTGLNFKTELPLRGYQKQCAAMVYHTGALLCGDELGTGKTVSGIGLIAQADARMAVVVTLTNLLPDQWAREIRRFLPKLNVYVAKRATPPDFKELPDVIVLSYSKLAGWASFIAGKAKSIIFDECHELRTGGGTTKYHSASVIAQDADFKLGLSATPVFNTGTEIWNIMNILSPGALGSKDEFDTEWCGGGGYIKDPRAFGAYLRECGYFLRRTKKDIGRELPALTIVPHDIEADIFEFNKHVGDADSIAELARTVLSDGVRGFDKMRAAEELSYKMRESTGIAKAPYLVSFLKMLLETNEKILVGLWHHAVYEILMDRLAYFRPMKFSGEESPTQKKKAYDDFVNGDCRLLLMSNRAGQGLDGIQAVCSCAVIGELDWSPSVHEQFIGRLYRDGQKDPVMAYIPIADIGSDPVISDTVGVKAQQLDGIRNPHNTDALKQIDPDRIKKLAADYLRRNKLSLPAPGEEEDVTLEKLHGSQNPF